MADTIILSICIVTSALVGIFVFFRNRDSFVNRVFGVLALALILFVVANYFSLKTDDRLFWIRLVMLMSTVIVTCLYFVASRIGDRNRKLTFAEKLGLVITSIVGFLDVTPFVFRGLTVSGNPVPLPDWGALFFVLHMIMFLVLSCVLLVRRIIQAQGKAKSQYKVILVGIAPMVFLAPVTGFVLPVVYGQPDFVLLSPVYVAFFTVMVGYAIVKHKLFDIRLIVARSVAYVVTITVLAAIYTSIIFAVSAFLIRDKSVGIESHAVYTVVALLLALSFGWIKSFFDTLSNKLFFRDSYEPQEFLDQLNEFLVHNVKLKPLLSGATDMISRILKSESVTFVIRIHEDGEMLYTGSATRLHKNACEAVIREAGGVDYKVIVADHLEQTQDPLRMTLENAHCAVAIRLVSAGEGSDNALGYLLLGSKKNGESYNKRDIETLKIVANELVVAIENSLRFEEIEQFNLTLKENIRKATAELQASNLKLKKLDETKDDFISMASHQLRTPLTSIKGYLSMALDGDVGELKPEQRKILEEAFASSQRMVYLIGDFLNVSRLQTGKFELETGSVQLTQLLTDEIAQLRATATSRNITFVYDPPSNFPVLQLDENKIRQVMMNFIDNAIYYAKPGGGTIRVELARQADYVTFKVIDDGIGVPVGEQRHLFTKFYRATNARKARPDGTGIGLFMAKKVVVAHGGAILFESTEGKGSMFGFRLPVKAAQEATGQSAPAPRSAT